MKHVIIIFCHLLRSRKVSNSNIEKKPFNQNNLLQERSYSFHEGVL